MNIISGEKFQYLADIYIGNKEFDKNCHIYNNTLYENKCIRLSNMNESDIEKIKTSKIIFIYTHIFITNRSIILDILSKKKNEFIIIFHNSDSIIDKSFLDLFQRTKCKKIFGQNVCYINENIQYLPIGLANSKWKHGNKLLFTNIVLNNVTKQNNVFFNFTIYTNYNKRKMCYNAFRNKLLFTKYNSQEEYLLELKKSKYCICPEGNGPDCHRLWECLYLDVIPICMRSTFIDNIAKDFPVYIVDKWENLQINDELYNNYYNYLIKIDKNKLSFDYWKEKIVNN